jgi:succinylarginine dihydrolase
MKTDAKVIEVNFDCLVGPTHHFGGLSLGNLASTSNKARRSNPKRAALQGIKKMKFLRDRGFVQAVLPPHERPHIKSFLNLGFLGPDHEILRQAYEQMPSVFNSFLSASAMWAANAATISPSSDSLDGLVHVTPANLVTMLHRCIEPEFTRKVFQEIFCDQKHFVVHEPLLAHDAFSDEGAANHNRLTKSHGDKGLQIFVYGKDSINASAKTLNFPARQSRLANEALALRHRLSADHVFNVAQNPEAIDKGAFHNDVVCVVNENLILCHEWAFLHQHSVLVEIRKRYQQLYGEPPVIMEVSNKELPIEDAVRSYLFNSQILTKPDGGMLLFAPLDCKQNPKAHAVINRLLNDANPIDEVAYFDVSESMANGGGPACLRLRVPLSPLELGRIKQSVLLTDILCSELEKIIEYYYIENLTIEQFFDQHFLAHTKKGLAEIGKVLGLGAIYDAYSA